MVHGRQRRWRQGGRVQRVVLVRPGDPREEHLRGNGDDENRIVARGGCTYSSFVGLLGHWAAVVVGHVRKYGTRIPPDRQSLVPLGPCPLGSLGTAQGRQLSLPPRLPRQLGSEKKRKKKNGKWWIYIN